VRPIVVLILIHAVSMAVIAFTGGIRLDTSAMAIVSCALFFAQLTLLGFATALSPVAVGRRVLGWLLGVGYLAVVLRWNTAVLPPFVLASVVYVVLFAVLRQRQVELRQCDGIDLTVRGGSQYSMRHLMLSILGVALLLGLCVALRNSTHFQTFLIPTWASFAIPVALATSWAALGSSRPFRRGLIAVLIALGFSPLFAYTAGGGPPVFYYLCATVFGLEALMLLGSLMVLRSCGFRLLMQA
jgi:hypothetical protein